MCAEKKDNLHAGHRQRMRDRFLKTGFDGFSEHQIVEMVLYYCCPRVDTNNLAHKLINEFGSFAGIIDASYDDLKKRGGLTQNAAVLFKMIPELLGSYYDNRTINKVCGNTDALKKLFIPYYIGTSEEIIRIACLNNSLGLICNVVIGKGSPSAANIDLRLLTETVMASKAAYVVMSHNHPQGGVKPSNEDIVCTEIIKDFLKNISVVLIDHVIVSGDKAYSMYENGNIKIV